MKQKINLLLFAVIYTVYSKAQWVKLETNLLGNGDFNDMEITDNSKIFIVKSFIVLESADLGLSWDTSLHDPSVTDYLAIDFLNNDTAYLAKGYDGGMGLRTFDGGETWQDIYPDNGYFTYSNDVCVITGDDVYFVSAEAGFGIVQISHDGCSTSETITPDLILSGGIGSISCISKDTCLCVSGDPFDIWDDLSNHNIYKTYNGGYDWTSIKHVTGSKDVEFTSKNVAYVRGEYEIVKSVDQGETWDTILELENIDTTGQFNASAFINDTVAYVAIFDFFNTPADLFRTINGGITWTKCTFDSLPGKITAIDCITPDHCFLTGTLGVVYETYNGGIVSVNGIANIPFSVFPNPSASQIAISLQNKNAVQHIITTNYLGEKVLLEWSTNLQADIASLPAGIYFTTIFTDSGKGVQKWVKL